MVGEAGRDLVFEDAQLLQQNGRLQGIEARVQADAQILVLVSPTAVHAQAGDLAAEQGERGLMASDLLAQLRRVVNP